MAIIITYISGDITIKFAYSYLTERNETERETAVKRADVLELLLKDVQAVSGVIEAPAVVSSDGLFTAGSLTANVEKDRFAVKSAAMFSLGERTVWEPGRGIFEEVVIKGAGG